MIYSESRGLSWITLGFALSDNERFYRHIFNREESGIRKQPLHKISSDVIEMRNLAACWIMELNEEIGFGSAAALTAISILDACVMNVPVSAPQLPMMAIASLDMGMKFHDDSVYSLGDMLNLAKGTGIHILDRIGETTKQTGDNLRIELFKRALRLGIKKIVSKFEWRIFKILEWNVNIQTPRHCISGITTSSKLTMVTRYISESLLLTDIYTRYSYTVVSLVCLYLAHKMLDMKTKSAPRCEFSRRIPLKVIREIYKNFSSNHYITIDHKYLLEVKDVNLLIEI